MIMKNNVKSHVRIHTYIFINEFRGNFRPTNSVWGMSLKKVFYETFVFCCIFEKSGKY